MRVAAVQMQSGADPFENLLFVQACVDEATERGCQLACFPENVFYRGPRSFDGFKRSDYFLTLDAQGFLETSRLEFAQALRECMDSWKISVSLGSVFEKAADDDKPFNSHWLVQPGGRVQAYRKIHLFDFTHGEVKYCESQDFHPGDHAVSSNFSDSAHGEFKLGLSICFDLRFPELYRDLVLKQKANVLLIPAAFAFETGKHHWDALLKARAIENLSYVVAAAQWGTHKNSKGQELQCFGRAQIVDPWGTCLEVADNTGDAMLISDLSSERIRTLRKNLPALECVRLYK